MCCLEECTSNVGRILQRKSKTLTRLRALVTMAIILTCVIGDCISTAFHHQPHHYNGPRVEHPRFRIQGNGVQSSQRLSTPSSSTAKDARRVLSPGDNHLIMKHKRPNSKDKDEDISKVFYISEQAEAQEGFEGDTIDRFWANIGPLLFPLPFFLSSLLLAAPVIPYTLLLQYNNTQFLG